MILSQRNAVVTIKKSPDIIIIFPKEEQEDGFGQRTDYINSVNLNIDTDFPYLVLDVIK